MAAGDQPQEVEDALALAGVQSEELLVVAAVQRGYVAHTLTRFPVLSEAIGALPPLTDAGAGLQVVSAARTTVHWDTHTLAGVRILCPSSRAVLQFALALTGVWVLPLSWPAPSRNALALTGVQQ